MLGHISGQNQINDAHDAQTYMVDIQAYLRRPEQDVPVCVDPLKQGHQVLPPQGSWLQVSPRDIRSVAATFEARP